MVFYSAEENVRGIYDHERGGVTVDQAFFLQKGYGLDWVMVGGFAASWRHEVMMVERVV